MAQGCMSFTRAISQSFFNAGCQLVPAAWLPEKTWTAPQWQLGSTRTYSLFKRAVIGDLGYVIVIANKGQQGRERYDVSSIHKAWERLKEQDKKAKNTRMKRSTLRN